MFLLWILQINYFEQGLYYYNQSMYDKAKDFFLKSTQKEFNSNSFLYLGVLYQNGYGVDQDYITAFSYLIKASEKGNDRALKLLGDFFYYGYGVQKDYSKAFEYYLKSAESKNIYMHYIV